MALSFRGGAGEVDQVAEAFDRHALTVEDVRHEPSASSSATAGS